MLVWSPVIEPTASFYRSPTRFSLQECARACNLDCWVHAIADSEFRGPSKIRLDRVWMLSDDQGLKVLVRSVQFLREECFLLPLGSFEGCFQLCCSIGQA